MITQCENSGNRQRFRMTLRKSSATYSIEWGSLNVRSEETVMEPRNMEIEEKILKDVWMLWVNNDVIFDNLWFHFATHLHSAKREFEDLSLMCVCWLCDQNGLVFIRTFCNRRIVPVDACTTIFVTENPRCRSGAYIKRLR